MKLPVSGRQVPAGSWRIVAYSSTPLETRPAGAYRPPMANEPALRRGSAVTAASHSSRMESAVGETRDAVRVAALCAELARLLGRWTGSDGGHETAIPQLTLWRFSNPTDPAPVMQEP